MSLDDEQEISDEWSLEAYSNETSCV